MPKKKNKKIKKFREGKKKKLGPWVITFGKKKRISNNKKKSKNCKRRKI